MDQNELEQFIESLEQEKEEQARAYWFDGNKKYETLEQYEKALQALKNIAYLQFDLEIE